MGGRMLTEVQLAAGLVEELSTARGDAVHYDDATGTEVKEHLGHDGLQMAAVAAYEDGVGKLSPCPSL